MTTAVQRRRGTSTQHGSFTGLEGEITVDTTKKTAVVHDGSTAGGVPLAKEDLTNTPVSVASGKTLTVSNSITLAGTDGVTLTTPAASGTLVTTDGAQTLTSKTINLASNTVTGTFSQFNTAVSDATLVKTTDKFTDLAAVTSAELAAKVTDETGSGALVFGTSPTLTTPNLGTPSAVTLTNATGLPTAGLVDNAVTDAKLRDSAGLSVIGRSANTSGDPADIAAASDHQVLRRSGTSIGFGAVALNQANAITGTLPVVNGGTGITSFGAGVATFLGTPSSANLAAAVTDETGTGALVFGTSPTIGTATINTPTVSGGTIENAIIGGTTPAAATFTTATATTGNIETVNSKIVVADLVYAIQIKVGSVVYTLPTADGTSGQALKTNGSGILTFGNAGDPGYGLFRKADPTIAAWTKTGNFTVSTATTLYVEVNGELKTIAASTAVTMPGSATAGTDYAIWAKTDGSLQATTDHTSPPAANARKVGGFHYAPGGNATGTSGGNTTAQINEYSFWDLKFRPACSDPRGMTLVAGGFWADIYLCGVDHYTNGTSKYNVTIADGSSLPKISAAFGGNGSTTYAGGTWFSFNEIMAGVGKRLPTYLEACAYAYGTTEASSGGTDPVSTILRQAYTSKWGVMLATGNMYQWLRDFIANGSGTGGWQTGLTETRGNIYTFGASARAGVFGGAWNYGSYSGSRCSYWVSDPSDSATDFGARGVCDHLQLD